MTHNIRLVIAVGVLLLISAGCLLPGTGKVPMVLADIMQTPSWGHWLGTDQLGRDIFAQLTAATRGTVVPALVAAAIALAAGWPLGRLARAAPVWVGRPLVVVAHILFIAPSFLLRPLWSSRVLMAICCAHSTLPAAALSLLATLLIALRIAHSDAALLFTSAVMFVPAVAFAVYRPAGGQRIAMLATSVFVWALLAQAAVDTLGIGLRAPGSSWGTMTFDVLRNMRMFGFWHALPTIFAFALTAIGAFCLGDVLSGHGRGEDRQSAAPAKAVLQSDGVAP